MSGTPKRLHEEGGHSTPSKRPLDDSAAYSSISGKISQPVSGDFHASHDHMQDARLAKVHRVDYRDDKRPSSKHRIPTPSSSFFDHPTASDSKLEPKLNKDARESRGDARPESRDAHGDIKFDFQPSSVEDVKQDSRVAENEIRPERRSHVDYKSDSKLEKDSRLPTSSHLSWRDAKEQHRGKRYFDSPGDGSDPWRFTRPGSCADETSRAPPSMEERNTRETYDINVEGKTDEKQREKDLKRKEEKHRELGDREKDRNDRRAIMQIGNTGDRKETQREDRDSEKWYKEKKDYLKDKEDAERDKDLGKKEFVVSTDKENTTPEKGLAGGSVRSVEHDNTSDGKIIKDDSWKTDEKDLKGRKKENDSDAPDKNEQRNKHNEKENDESCAEGDLEKDKEVFSGSQQRRRLRTRGSNQSTQREPRFKNKMRDNDGSQGKDDGSAIVYKAGECMQELLKSWKDFEAANEDKASEALQNGPTLEIRIPAEYVTSTNRQVKGAQLWGTDIYTNDSDLVAVLMHAGYCSPTSSPPPSTIQELRATVRVLPPQDCYTSTLRNNVRSRAWGAGIPCSFRIERCCIVKKGGGTIDLEPRLSHTSAVEPTLAPVIAERTMTTRAAASNALRQQRFVREVTIQYNLCNEPWLKYSINIVADKGLKKSLYTSARLKKGEVIYLETHSKRYELCYVGEKTGSCSAMSTSNQPADAEHQSSSNHQQNGDRGSVDQDVYDAFRWSRCKKPLPESEMRSVGIPMPVEHLEVLEESLQWEDVQWSQTSVWVAGKEYPITRVHFLSP